MDINEVATKAARVRKPQKASVFAIVRRVIERGLDDDDLVNLYAYFIPSSPAKAKTAEQWAAKAMANKKEVRHYLRYVYSDGGRLIATDGHRLHVAPTTLKEGFYDAAMTPIVGDGKFPDVDRVIPNHKKELKLSISKCELRASSTSADHLAAEVAPKVWVSLRYFKEAANRADEVRIMYGGPHDAVKVYSEHGFAVVMPIRMADEVE